MSKSLHSAFLIALVFGSLVLIGTVHFGTAQIETSFSVIISSDTTWTQANSPYNLTGPIVVNSGVTLKIEAGAAVNINGHYILVNGALVARGTNTDPIYINGGNNTYPNYPITFPSFSKSWNEQNTSGCIIENSILTSAPIDISGASPKINNNILEESPIHIQDGSPIISNNTLTNCNISSLLVGGGFPTISNNTITNGGISVSHGDPSLDFSTVSNNTIINGGQYGIECRNGYASIHDNHISGSQYGILITSGINDTNIFDDVPTSPIIERNLITNNTQGIRILLSFQPFAGTKCPLILNNTISNNIIGIYLSESNYNSTPTIVNNNIQNNDQNNVYLSGISNNVNATYNWWGTNDTQAINQTIHDFKNDFNLGIVNFVPFLTTPNLQAVPNPKVPIQTPNPTPTQTQSPPPSSSPSPSIPEFPTWMGITLLLMATSLTLVLVGRKKFLSFV